MIWPMTKDLNEFAGSVLDTIIANHDPESVTDKDAKRVASGLMELAMESYGTRTN